MKKYNVNVNGTQYQIEIEEVANFDASAAAAPKAPAAPAAPAASAPAGGQTITSPMPGTILALNVSTGDSVKKGQVLMVLEAMKMENEIMAPCDGKVTSVTTSKGASVESGAVLCTIA